MTNSGYPYEGFEDMFPQAKPTPNWYGFGHKNYVYNKVPVRHIILADGQQHSEIDIHDPDQPLDHIVADRLRGQPAERPHFRVSDILSVNMTIRPGAREGMEYGQFNQPDTRPGVLPKHRQGRKL